MWDNKLDIYEREWLEVVFSSRNQSYGAYDLRRRSASATNKALITVICIVLLLVGWKAAYDHMSKNVTRNTERAMDPVTIDELVEQAPPVEEEEPLPAVDKPVQKIAQDPPATELIRFTEPVVTDKNKVTEDVVSQKELKDKMTARISLKPARGGSFIAKGEFGPQKEHGAMTGKLNGDTNGEGAGMSIVDFRAVEVLPTPVDGMPAFVKWVGQMYQYPNSALEQGIKGSVLVSFVVERDGSLTDMKIVRDLGFGTGEEALRVLKKAKKWKPGIQNGREVRVSFTLPIKLSTI
ncbi:energy transducer TonB [Sphingobacterium suaedae]|uniref:Energy transducer TonB n=1 Tax=Sphingobacterium suaedae TaxID=1686402 RepID=A0ABW5KDL5_9SPHI